MSPTHHYEIKETKTFTRFRILDNGYNITIFDDEGDVADSEKIVVKREHLPKLIEILTKILKGDEINGTS